MKKSDGILSLKKAAKLLNKHAPQGESLAYINPEEAKLLRSHGGSGIMTLPGVPSYAWDWDTVKNIGKKALEYAPTVIDWFKGSPAAADEPDTIEDMTDITYRNTGTEYDDPYYQTRTLDVSPKSVWSDIATGAKKWAKERYSDPTNILKDATAVGTTVWGIYDDYKKGKIAKDEFERQIAEEAANRAEVQANLGGFQVENIPGEEEIAQFTEVDIPEMSTTPWAAEGGRIGYFNGGIQGLMPQQGPVGFMPQQGLMPQQRIGFKTGTPKTNFQTWLKNNGYKIQSLMQPGELALAKAQFKKEYGKAQGGRIGYNQGSGRTYEEYIKYRNETIATGNIPEKWDTWKLGPQHEIEMAQGGRIGAQKGGIMPLLNLGGMEKDYRQDGGFVPIGRKEKADDVPARLSKNEFVFTADAVKAAGGGDIDEGAQRMYNVMKNLEAGGDISQQSQGRG